MLRRNRSVSSLKHEASRLYSRGKKLDALTLFAEACKLDRNDDYCWFMRGLLVSEVSKLYESGIKFFERAISINPKKRMYWDAKANNLSRLGRIVESQECFKEAERLKEIEELYAEGRSLYKSKNYELAAECYGKISALDLDDAIAFIKKGNCFAKLNRLDEAKDCYNTGLLKMDSTSQIYFSTKGRCKINLGNYEDGIKDIEKALEMGPTHISWLKTLAFALSKAGKKDEAIKYCDKVVQKEPYSERTWKYKGELHLALGQLDKSLESFDKATKINTKDPGLWQEKGKVFSLLGDQYSALKCFDNGLKINSKRHSRLVQIILMH